jgi:hypothetical protein
MTELLAKKGSGRTKRWTQWTGWMDIMDIIDRMDTVDIVDEVDRGHFVADAQHTHLNSTRNTLDI